MTYAVLYLAVLAFLPLVYSTAKSISIDKLSDRAFSKMVAKEYLRTFPTLALVSIPLVIFPAHARAYVIAMHAIFMWMVIMELGHIYMFGARMGLNTFYSLFVTNMRETLEYIRNNQTRLQWVIILSVYVLPFFLLAKLQPITFSSEYTRLAWLALLTIVTIPLIRNFFTKGSRHKLAYVLNPFVSVFYHFALYKRQYGALMRQIAEHSAPPFEDIVSSIPSDAEETYVICIGESANAQHHAYAGYARDTNEFTRKEGDILSFKGVRSQYAQTLPSLEKTITFATDVDPKALYSKGSIVDYFKDAGFKTFWLSNQYALEDTAITAMAGHADVRKCFNFSTMKGFETAGYDGQLLPEFEKVLNDSAKKKVIFLHMIGSHAAYVNRYPAEFRHFTDVLPGKEHLSSAGKELLNTYDDSIRYTDYIISRFVQELRKRSGIAYLVYFSDHGEDCFDTTSDKLLGHSQLANLPMTSVPLQVWLSAELRSLRPDLLTRKAKSEYKLEEMVHFLIDLASLKNPDFDVDHSFLER